MAVARDPQPAETPRPRAARDTVFAVRRAAPTKRRLPWRRLLAAVGAVVVLGAAGWWLAGSGAFAVSRIGTGDYRFTDERALRQALTPLLGRNLWALGPGEVRQALARLPWVREVHVQRRLPGAVDIELVEWRPLLVVAEPGAPAGSPTLVLVEDGRVLPFPPRLPPPDLPVMTGLVVERAANGPARLPADVVPSVLELVSAMEASGLEAAATVDFVVAGPEGYSVVLRDREATLLVGRDSFAERLTRYLTARAHVDTNLVVDLRFRDRLTVRPMPTAATGDEGEGEDQGEPGDGGDAPGGGDHGNRNGNDNDARGAGRVARAKERA